MNARTPLLVAFLAAPFSVQAGDVIKQLSDHTGVSERKVQMILGARSSFAEYPYTYQRSLEKFRAALGEENYRRAMNGESFVLETGSAPDEAGPATADATPATEPAPASRQERITGS